MLSGFSIMRSFYSLSFSLVVTFLHVGCCLLPLFSLLSLPLFNVSFLTSYQPFFTVLQWAIFIWLTGRLVAFRYWSKNFHSRTEKLSYVAGWLIALSGLVINWWEPFKTEQQVLAAQQFERFKSQRQLSIELTGTYNKEELLADLHRIDGVRKVSIGLEAHTVNLSYHKEKVSAGEIFEVLKKKGYVK